MTAYVLGKKDKIRRRVSVRSSTVTVVAPDGTQHNVSIAYNPHPVTYRSGGRKSVDLDQSLRTDQVLCDLELEPGKWVLQVVQKSRIIHQE